MPKTKAGRSISKDRGWGLHGQGNLRELESGVRGRRGWRQREAEGRKLGAEGEMGA